MFGKLVAFEIHIWAINGDTSVVLLQVRRGGGGSRSRTLVPRFEGLEWRREARPECFVVVVREMVTAGLGGRGHAGTDDAHKHFHEAAK
jgi:hypothetical protein